MHIIRTSDRKAFLKCRRAWDFGSKIRQDYEPNQGNRYYDFGTAMHRGWETYYQPATWEWDKEVVRGLSLHAFAESWKAQRAQRFQRGYNPSEEEEIEWQADLELGLAMLRNFHKYSEPYDKAFQPKLVEIEFQVGIPDPTTGKPFVCSCHGWPVVYQGRIDLVVVDQYGQVWIVDFKTAKQLRDNMSFLLRDPQVGSYCWALQIMKGIKVAGVIYWEARKDAPHPPNVLQKGGLSKNKQQNTTYEMYLEEIHKRNLDPKDYVDMLTYLEDQGNKFFRRTKIDRSQAELLNLGVEIYQQAKDMIDPNIVPYKNADMMNCYNCAFQTPCLALDDGSDVEWIMKELYHKREEVTQ